MIITYSSLSKHVILVAKGKILKKPRYKLLATDVDGTLIGQSRDVSPENRAALQKAKAAGILVALSTGRPPQAGIKLIESLSLDDYHIFFDGALVTQIRTGEVVYSQPIKPALVEEMVSQAKLLDVYIEISSADKCYAGVENWWTEINREFFDTPIEIGDLNGLWDRFSILKGQLVLANREERLRINEFINTFRGRLEFREVTSPAYPDRSFINVLAAGVSKGLGLQKLAEHLNIPIEQVAAIGDWLNDIQLLAAAGLGIAMGNAHSEVKHVADEITLDVDQHGFAHAVEKYLL
jgi:Cof subfamily protein (haloacid dehalogenase superfamily)